MNTFTWLMIGHMIGDWLLQNDWMTKGKKQGFFTWAGTVHFTIYTVTTIGALWLSGVADRHLIFYLSLSAISFSSHWLIDATDGVKHWMRFYRQTELELVRVMVDQTLHLLVLLCLTLLSFP